MIYLRWGKEEMEGLEKLGLSHVITECDADGSVLREIGFDCAGKPMHRAPDLSGIFLFELQKVDLSNQASFMSTTQFDAAWLDASLPPRTNQDDDA